MGFIDEIKARAKVCKKTIVLPETEDERTYKAAEAVLKEGIADLVLVGSKEEIEKNKGTYDISGAAIVDPATDARTEGYIAKLVELRQKKGMTPEQAKELLLNNYLYFQIVYMYILAHQMTYVQPFIHPFSRITLLLFQSLLLSLSAAFLHHSSFHFAGIPQLFLSVPSLFPFSFPFSFPFLQYLLINYTYHSTPPCTHSTNNLI